MLIELLSKTAKIPEAKLLSLSNTASRRYKVYTIPKRSGGERMIEHPSRELKALQRWLVKALIGRFPVHEAATAYRKGTGIRVNAERHRQTKFTNRYDFANFFPSFSQRWVVKFIGEQAKVVGIDLSERDLHFIGNIVCRNGRLTIGAPSSPAITNAMMFEFDQSMHEFCLENGIIYTRYADDIFISSNEVRKLDKIERIISNNKGRVEHLSLKLNKRKTTYLSKKYHRSITGVVITPDHKLSIGRDRKRKIKSLIHRWIEGKLPASDLSTLRGLVAFARDIEPRFEVALAEKYGKHIIDEILRSSDLSVTPLWTPGISKDGDGGF